jgi:hypothetical protein
MSPGEATPPLREVFARPVTRRCRPRAALRARGIAVLAFAALLAALPLRAQTTPAEPRTALTVSPLHLLNPQLQITGEVRLAPKWSVATTVGGGRVTEEEQTFRTWEIGAQVRSYIIGSFARGLMVGADVGYVDVDGQPEGAMEMLAGTRAGGFLGYKGIWNRGFTAEVQLGPVYVRGDAGDAEWQTLHRLTLGWSW